MEKNVCIVHFNSPIMTRATIRSVWKHTPDCKITIFDNSNSYPFGYMEGVSVYNNTNGNLIDFKKFLSEYPDKKHSPNEWGSAKHSKTIDFLFRLFPDGFVLMDSDVLIKRDISDLFDDKYVFVGKTTPGKGDRNNRNPRLLPFLCWINTKMCSENGIHFFDGNRSWKLHKGGPDKWYDTGSSFYLDCLASGLPFRTVNIDDYMIHFYGGSYKKDKDWRGWLDQYRDLYE